MTAKQLPGTMSVAQVIQPQSEEGGLQLGQVFSTLRRKSLLILGITTVVTVLAQVSAMRDKPVYSSGFEILTRTVTAESEVISSVPDTLTSRQNNTETTQVLDATKIKVLLSPSVLNPVIDQLQPEHPELTYNDLVSGLVVQANGQDILLVQFSSEDAELVTDVMEAVSQAYLAYSLEQRQRDIRQGIAFVEEQLPDLEARVARGQERLQRFRQTYNLINPEILATQYAGQSTTLAQQQLDNQTQLDEARLLYLELQEELANQSAESAGSSVLSNSARYQQLLDQILAVDSKIAQDSSLYLPDSLEIQVLEDQRRNLIPLLEREALRTQRNLLSQIRELENRSQAVAQSIEETNEAIRKLSVITREYNEIQQELQIATDNLNQFLAKREGLRIDAAQRQIPWQLLTPPAEPYPSAASLKRSLMLGGILGLLLGVGAALALDKLSNVIRTEKELKELTRLPLLGAIPLNDSLKTASDIYAVSNAYFPLPEEIPPPFLEAFRTLYTNIRLLSPGSPLQVLAISSAVPSSGKSTVSLYLAQVAASMGKKVLLVDTDLRRPMLHQYLGLGSSKGLTDIVSENLDPAEVTHQISWESNLFVITCGTIPPDPAKILASQNMQEFVKKSREEYDLIIFDTVPLLGLADTYLLSPFTEGFMLVVRLNELKRVLLEQTLEALHTANVPMLGTIANGAELTNQSAYSYYYTAPSQQATKASHLALPSHITRSLKPLEEALSKLKQK